MNKLSIKMTSMLLCGVVFSSSCSHMNDEQKTKAQTTTIGTVSGAVIGGGAGYGAAKLAGASDRNAAWVAIAGAALGSLAGYNFGKSWGESIVREKQAYKNQEAYLKANITQTQKRTSQVNRENRELVKVAAQLRDEKKSLLAANDKAAIKEYNKGLNNDIKSLNNKLALVDKDIVVARQAIKGSSEEEEAQKLKKELAKLVDQRASYKKNTNAIAGLVIK